MKKVLVGLFLIASLSILGVNNKSIVNKENYSINNYSVVDANLMNMYSKEKTEFKNKYIALSEKADRKNLIILLKKYIKKYPDDAFAYEEIGTKYYALNNLKEAEKYYLKTVELANNDTGVYSLGLLYNDTNFHFTNNEKDAKKKIENAEQLLNNGFTHESLKELREHKQMALIGNAYSIYRLAVYYYGTKNYKIAEKYAKEFLEFDKKNPEILNILSSASK